MYSSMAHREGAITALGQCDPGMPFPTLPDPPEISFQTKANQDSSLCNISVILQEIYIQVEEKRKEILIYLFVEQKACLSAGIAKLIFTMHRLAKITSAMRNIHGVV